MNRSLASSSASGNVLLTSSFSVSSATFLSSEDDDVEEIEVGDKTALTVSSLDFLSFNFRDFSPSVYNVRDKIWKTIETTLLTT